MIPGSSSYQRLTRGRTRNFSGCVFDSDTTFAGMGRGLDEDF
jgi:hypothetical protein